MIERRTELSCQLHVVVVLAMLVTLVEIGFVLVIETGLYSGLPEVFDCGSDCVCDGVMGGGGGGSSWEEVGGGEAKGVGWEFVEWVMRSTVCLR